MSTYDTIEELFRIARLPEIDDDQLATLVAALASTDSYVDQEDGGYGSTYSRESEVTVRGSAESALCEAAPKVVAKLVARLAGTQDAVREALLRVVAAVDTKAWAAQDAGQRARALASLEQLSGASSKPLATLVMHDDTPMSLEARARDLIALRLLVLDATGNDVERAVEPIVRALLGPSKQSGEVARDAAAFMRGSRTLGPRLVDALFDPAHAIERARIPAVLATSNVRLDAGQRARLAAALDDSRLGYELLVLLAPWLADASAEAELPLASILLPRIARECAKSTDEGTWRYWIARCGRAALAQHLVPEMHRQLAGGRVREEQLHSLALLGGDASPLAPELVRYLDPSRSPSGRHVLLAAKLAAVLASPVFVPALTALLPTRHQYEAVNALAAIGPPAAAAVPALEALSYVKDVRPEKLVREACANAIAKIRAA